MYGTFPNVNGKHPTTGGNQAYGTFPMMALSYVARQIKKRMEVLETNPRHVSRRAGLNDTAVRDIIEGNSKNPRHDTLAKIAKVLGCTLADLTGERPIPKPAAISDVVTINELDVHAASGAFGTTEAILASEEPDLVVGTHTFPAASFREAYGVSPSRIKILPVRGNSMEPELWSGQRVMVDVEDTTPSPPGIFVVWDGLGLVLKYVEVIANSEPIKVRISSAHQAFKPYERNLKEAYINGRVIGVWKRV